MIDSQGGQVSIFSCAPTGEPTKLSGYMQGHGHPDVPGFTLWIEKQNKKTEMWGRDLQEEREED